MADLGRIATNTIQPGSGTSVRQCLTNDDLDIKKIYEILNKLRGAYKGAIAPSSPNVGDLWNDSATDTLKEWDGSAWVVASFMNAANIPYDNSTSGLTADQIQEAIDELASEKMQSPSPLAQGDIFYRGASAIERLPAGTTGQVLKTGGEGANPSWADGVVFASTVEAQDGTDNTKAISPLRLREALNSSGNAPIYACRAWVNFNGTGTVAIRASGNVSSITDNGVGTYKVNFTIDMPDVNFNVVTDASSGGSLFTNTAESTAYVVSSVNISTYSRGTNSGTSTKTDMETVNVSIFR